jgi:YebC/PmpR family DNA-binding regulatory protein
MARHSHWHNIQLKKGKADAKKGQVFSKLSKGITVAAKEGGGDVGFNFKLRVAVESARAANMTRDAIEKAIARGTGEGGAAEIVEVVYEGFGPGGVAMIIKCLTDNRARTVADVKHAASKNNGTIGAIGSVMWMFEKKGVVMIFDRESIKDREAFELAAIEAGATDIRDDGEAVMVICEISDLQNVMEAVEKTGAKVETAAIEYVPKETIKVEDAAAKEQLDALIEAFEENDDVDTVFTNEA